MTTNTKYSLTSKILIAMALGILVGAFFKWIIGNEADKEIALLGFSFGVKAFFVDGIFHVGGQIFVASLKMLVVPLVLVSLVCGTSSLKDISTLGRIGSKAMGMFILTTAMAIALAIFFAVLVSPGSGVNMQLATAFDPGEVKSVAQVFIDMFPSNPIDAMAKGEMLQIIIFAVLFGIAITMSGAAGERIRLFFEDMNVIVMQLVELVMKVSPYGVFFLMAKLFTTLELADMANLGKYFGVVLFVLFFHGVVVYGSFLFFVGRLNPIIFFSKMRETALFAFSTSSSNATVASNLATTTHKLGVDNKVASFTIPLGATINMDGTAIMQGVATVFIAQVYNIDLDTSDYLMVVLTATLASIGTAGVPGVGLVMLAMVLEQVGLPVEGIALILGVDRLLDMTRTAVNITGDAMISCLVAKQEKCFDAEVYNDPKAGEHL
ncbi:dicarboxylate/amino acid:cation symporter [Rheinheimera riviphila]|uniref:Dicarboxylate/amino acid:cation symporter n=2 Tax=Rheinheimera riviphila TaxID=1834037 RepID=A0A437R355_9GAMM|nr:dicarboxylate/amino acid:cation symporter [Rheinheimera riviphila]